MAHPPRHGSPDRGYHAPVLTAGKGRRALVALLAAVSIWAVPVGSAGVAAGSGSVAPTLRQVAGDGRFVRQRPCPESIFTCVTLRVPRDHFAPPGGLTFDVTFAIHRASVAHPKGVFVTITGGPGTSGLAAADSYTAAFDERIAKQYDLVFLDQRGVGRSEPLQCPEAALAFYTTPVVPTTSPAQALAYAADAKRFSRDCIAETGVAQRDLPFFSTRQAVEDLEDFRAWLGAPKIDLYGESYGSQYVQTYALAHPGRLHSLMIDGPVDLTLGDNAFTSEQARAFDSTLAHTLDACSTTTACRRDVLGDDALAVYDSLADRLRDGPIAFRYVRADGSSERRWFTLTDLEFAASSYLYDTFDRMLLQRAFAWASRGELLPLARLAYLSYGEDPDSLKVILDPTWSDAMYYAVECMDYDLGPGSTATRTARFLAAGEAAHMDTVRMGSIFYGDLPCASWPARPEPGRPPYLTDTPFPVFVLGATWDPATPFAGAQRIFSHLSDGYLIVQPGGPHIIFGRGNACPDDTITAYLLHGTRPASRTTTCDFHGVDDYARIPAAQVDTYRTALAAMRATDDELNNNADYWSWDGSGTLRVGCLFGGSMAYTATADGSRVRLRDCALTRGLPLTGRATIDDTDGTFQLEVTAPGGTDLKYDRDADGHRSVSGTYRGEPA